jgi:hypothetical protein
MCVEYETTTVYSNGCQNPQCNSVKYTPGNECAQKPSNGRIRECPNYELRTGASNRVKGRCPMHRS